jgi:NADH:ubiquinone oxidoreductase subunit E
MNEHKVEEIIERHGNQSSYLIAILQDVQAEYRYLPEDILSEIADRLDIPLSRTYSLATFYNAFSLEPRGDHTINVCMGTACHVRGAGRILEKIERDLNVKTGETTEDLNFSLGEVYCLGCCGLAPVVTVDDDLYGKVTLTKISGILKKYKK